MKPRPEIAEQGLRAYEQAGAYQRLRKRRGLIVAYAFCPVGLLLIGWAVGDLGHAALAYALLAAAIFSMLGTAWYWRHLEARHARNLALLASLEKQYGDDLPWLEVERHMAALSKLMDDLDREKERTDGN